MFQNQTNNTGNRTRAHLASIQAIWLCFSESSRILRWGSKKNVVEKIKISIFFIISKKSLETSKSQFLYDQFLKDLKGNLKFEQLTKMLSMNKKSQKLSFSIKLFFQSYLFPFLLRKKEQNR